MSTKSQSIALNVFLSTAFDQRSDWGVRDVAVSPEGWSVEITHNDRDWTWSVMGDSESIMFRITEGARPMTFSLFAGNPPKDLVWALHALNMMTTPQMWGWLAEVEEEQTFEESEYIEVE